ncbi:hypothetical protein HH310_08515 [Actinoplanes sp. TBRC 11911]|uniref:hypothetical protein n=1 Tax=Actinoplanes sp. TBRC 11911 TaxID=2729386 RepID=UPI00145EDCF9|nr:hypothetical protein [Actinoplanes sp. TBRC 11911]NMO51228.1 hypothetical protein [Actinoplanes sp. TBRC 11911]
MSMADEGVYVSRRRRVQRRKKALVAVVGMAAVLGGAGYGVTAWKAARESPIMSDLGALAPTATPSSESPSPSPAARSAKPAPAPRWTGARLVGVPQKARPSPTPTPAGRADDAVAAAQVSRLLQARRPAGTLVAASEAITVATEAGPDGTTIRIVAARYDLTARGDMLWAADNGQAFADVRCTQNLVIDAKAQVRPGMMLCWRASAGRSVVAVATSVYGRPPAASISGAIDRAWRRLSQ